MKRLLAAVCITACLIVPAQAADNGTLRLESAHDARHTLDRLEAIFKAKGITVFARVDHAKGAASVEAELPPTEVLFFGNPKLGTPLMQADREVGFDLPMRALAWTDADGKTWLDVTDPRALKTRYKLDSVATVIEKMAGAVTAMAGMAVAK